MSVATGGNGELVTTALRSFRAGDLLFARSDEKEVSRTQKPGACDHLQLTPLLLALYGSEASAV